MSPETNFSGNKIHCSSRDQSLSVKCCMKTFESRTPNMSQYVATSCNIHPCHTAAILNILGMKSRRCVANLRFAAINHAKQRFQCALMCPCAQITDQKVN